MDIVVAVGSESVNFLSQISPCLGSNRIFLYVSSGNGVANSLTPHAYKNKEHLSEWLRQEKNNVFVSEIANTWSGTEASAFSLHIVTHYYDMAPKTIFLHAHDGSWHSGRVCKLVRTGLAAQTKFLNLNLPYPLRCLSPSKFTGYGANAHVRDFYYANWRKWTNSTPPKRIVFECCAQFLASKHAIHNRPMSVWANILRSVVHDRLGNNWEYLWPTLIDENGTSQLSTC